MSDLFTDLLAIRAKRGVLNPVVVEEEARPEEHPLHDRFEWDDSLAAVAHRRTQAHQLIQSVRVKFVTAGGEPKSVRAFHAVRLDPTSDGFEYLTAREISTTPLTREMMLAAMRRDFAALRERYAVFSEWSEMIAAEAMESALAI